METSRIYTRPTTLADADPVVVELWDADKGNEHKYYCPRCQSMGSKRELVGAVDGGETAPSGYHVFYRDHNHYWDCGPIQPIDVQEVGAPTVAFQDAEKFRSVPSLALPAVCFLDDYLTRGMKVFEWGSGASTLFFGMHDVGCVTIEHDKEWYGAVIAAMRYRGFASDIRLIEAQSGSDSIYGSAKTQDVELHFQQYVDVIEEFADDTFDLVLVDGRARCACLEIAQSKVKPGGVLMLDDSHRVFYKYVMNTIEWPVLHLYGSIPYKHYTNLVRTTVWVKGDAR